MKIKKFTAKDIKEGKRLVIEELGDDAVILSNRAIKDSNGDDAVEIVAAIDETINKSKPFVQKDNFESPNALLNRMSKQHGTNNNEMIMGELDSIKSMISEIGDSIKYRNTASMGTLYSKLYKKMRQLEISDEQSLRVINRLTSIGNIKDYSEALFEARKVFIEGIEIGKTLQKGTKCRIVLFIGTTGSGKTASLVKLSIISKLVQNANSLIISADTYKVGASEQLETFSSIASIPFRAAFTTDDIVTIISENQSKDFIFVDTTGFSQKDAEQVAQISDIVKNISPDLIYITIPATISELNANSVLSALKSITIDSVIITKTDESETIGGLINVIRNYKLPISYITTGVKIPEDIQPADRVILGKLSIKE
jgi:flagellar biosynthesis protein FlhF